MRTVTLFLAVSLDGFLADPNGGVGWLEEAGGDGGAYGQFIRTVDTVVMGWNTYRQITQELSPGQWVYEGLTCYVVTHREMADTPSVRFVREGPCALVERLRRESGGGIWICGGADLARQLMAADLIDCYDLSLAPLVLGGGIPLFPPEGPRLSLELVRAERSGGFGRVIFRKNPKP